MFTWVRKKKRVRNKAWECSKRELIEIPKEILAERYECSPESISHIRRIKTNVRYKIRHEPGISYEVLLEMLYKLDIMSEKINKEIYDKAMNEGQIWKRGMSLDKIKPDLAQWLRENGVESVSRPVG